MLSEMEKIKLEAARAEDYFYEIEPFTAGAEALDNIRSEASHSTNHLNADDANPVKPMDILNKILDHSQERAMAWTKVNPAPTTDNARLRAALEKGLDFVAQMKDQIRTLPGEVDTFEEMAKEALKDVNG